MKLENFDISIENYQYCNFLHTCERNEITIENIREFSNLDYEYQDCFSGIIESIIMGIPLPKIYLIFDKSKNTYEIISSDLKHSDIINKLNWFIEECFNLTNLQFYKEYNSKYYSELDEWAIHNIWNVELNFVILNTTNKNTKKQFNKKIQQII